MGEGDGWRMLTLRAEEMLVRQSFRVAAERMEGYQGQHAEVYAQECSKVDCVSILLEKAKFEEAYAGSLGWETKGSVAGV